MTTTRPCILVTHLLATLLARIGGACVGAYTAKIDAAEGATPKEPPNVP